MSFTPEPVDSRRILTWFYNNSPNLNAWLEKKQEFIDESHVQFWTDWYVDVFDLRTANDFGLAVWSLILDVPIFVRSPDPAARTWGFGQFNFNFNNSNFAGSTSTVIPLSTDDLRVALRMRFYQLHTDGTIPHINAFLADLFESQGSAYVRDNHDMTITYVFDFALDQNLALVLERYKILPTPAGISDSIEINP